MFGIIVVGGGGVDSGGGVDGGGGGVDGGDSGGIFFGLVLFLFLITSRASHILSKHNTNVLCPQPYLSLREYGFGEIYFLLFSCYN